MSLYDSACRPPFYPKPPIPRKPPLPQDSRFPLLAERGSATNIAAGKVRRIVERFDRPGSTTYGQEAREGRGRPFGKPKTAPDAKHGPPQLSQEHGRPRQKGGEKDSGGHAGRNTTLTGQREGRSAPDGREVEAPACGERDTGQGSAAPPSPTCEKKRCSCSCHRKHPGLGLTGEEEEEGHGEGEGGERRKRGPLEVARRESSAFPGATEFWQVLRTKLSSERRRDVFDAAATPRRPCPSPRGEREEAAGRAAQATEESRPKSLPAAGLPTPPCQPLWSSPILRLQAGCQGPKRAPPPPPSVPPRSSRPPDKAGSPRSSSTPSGMQPCPLTERGLRRPPPKPPHFKCVGKAVGRHVCPRLKEEKETDLGDGEKEGMNVEPAPAPSVRRLSPDLESRLKDEPLYQTYRANVITKKMRHQVIRSTSGVNSSGDRKGPAQSTLWQELPSVRRSRVLEHLSAAECKRQESMFEVLTSEASYLRSLLVLTDHFLESRDLDETLIIREKKTLFSNILRVREVSERFMKDLEQRVEEGPVISDICDIIHDHAQHSFSAYIDYIRNQVYQEKTYSSLLKRNGQFATVITRLQGSPLCQRLPFTSFLLLPFQRITRIKMLIENILKRTPEGTKEEQTASKALASVSQIIQECNSQVGKMKQVEELIHISQMLEFNSNLKAIPIISQIRFLEKRGELQEMSRGGAIFSLRPKFTPVYLFLFNDLLIFTYKKSSERYVVTDHAHRSLVQVQVIGEDKRCAGFDRCFCLMLLENHQGSTCKRLLKAPTQSDMHRWMAAFPNPTSPDREKDEVVYEDWDCPQVQCLKRYVAQQGDELDLEPTDIVNVVRKTNEGWHEGIRLYDGKKGWFPAQNVLEITNEHVRRRNLRKQYRIARVMAQAGTEEPGQAPGTLYQNTAHREER